MKHQNPHQNLAWNLRLLCDQERSVSDVCRKTEINRQQFNKYLAGLHRPSPANLRRIAVHFGIAPSSLELPHSDFRGLLDGDYFAVLDQIRRSPKSKGILDALMAMDQSAADRLVGRYERYQYSSLRPGTILRAPFCIYRRGALLMHYYVERFPGHSATARAKHVFKYHGLAVPMMDRIYSMDFESLRKNEITLSIFGMPQPVSGEFTFGLTTGITATMARPPFATRIALHYRGPGILQRGDLRRATLLSKSDPDIPSEALEFLDRERDMVTV